MSSVRLRSFTTVALVVALGAARTAAPAAAEPVAAPTCTAEVDAHVVDAGSHAPLAGVTVRNGDTLVGESDAAGHVAIAGVCPGVLVLELERADLGLSLHEVEVGADVATVTVELEVEGLVGETIELVEAPPPPPAMGSTTTLTAEALERTRGRAFADVLADVPGVSLLRTGSGLAKPIVRGQYGRRLLLLVDGVRHRAQEWGLDHTPEVDPFVADELTVVRGAAGVAYGPDAIGGAIIATPPALRRAPGVEGELHVTGTDNGRGGGVAARVNAASARWPGLAAMAWGTARRQAAPSTPDYPLDNTGAAEWSVGATVGVRRGETRTLLSYQRYAAELGVCTCVRTESRDDFLAQLDQATPTGVELYRPDFDIERPSQEVTHDLAIARHERPAGDLGTLRATAAVQYDHRREYDVVRQATTGPQFRFRLLTGDLDVALDLDPIHLDDHLHLRGQAGVVGMAQQHRYGGLPLVPDHVAGAGGAYLVERLVGHDYELQAGLRYDLMHRAASIERTDFLRLVRSGQLAEDACGPLGDTASCASTFHTVSASLGGLYLPRAGWTTRLDLQLAQRPPNPDEQYLNGTSPTFPVLGLGKPDLGAETTVGATASASYQGERLALEVSAYGNRIDDYISFEPAIDASGEPIFDVLIRGTFPRFVTRPIDALFYGADGGVTARATSWLELAGSASLVRARERGSGRPLVFVPPDRFTASATARHPGPWGLGPSYLTLSGTYVARQTRFDPDADLAPPPPAYALLGAEVGVELRADDQTFRVALSGQNLTNARYRDYTSLLRYFADQPGRALLLRLERPVRLPHHRLKECHASHHLSRVPPDLRPVDGRRVRRGRRRRRQRGGGHHHGHPRLHAGRRRSRGDGRGRRSRRRRRRAADDRSARPRPPATTPSRSPSRTGSRTRRRTSPRRSPMRATSTSCSSPAPRWTGRRRPTRAPR
ncbi:MAG: TonB-dependent receptor [Kofleriaceae bacterium]